MNQLKSGAILSYLSLFITILIALFYTPLIIRALGQAEYGLYALIGSIAAYFSIMDMGLGNTIVRFNARNRAIGDRSAEAKLNGMFFILYSLIGLATIITGVFLYNKIDSIFGSNLADMELEKAKVMVIILIVNFALSFPLAVFGSIMQAYEKFIVSKLVTIARSLLVPAITVPLLLLGHGSISMVIITSGINIACLLFNVFYCYKYLNISLHFGKIDFPLLREILGYSFFIFLNVIVNTIYWNTDQFILGAVAGTLPVAVYAIGMQLINLYMLFSTSISNLFLPKMSIMVANNATKQSLSNIMIRVGRLQFIIIGYILCGFILFGKTFITIWAGSNYEDAYYIILIIMLPLTIPLIQNVGITILQALDLHMFRSVIYLVIAMLNIVISYLLALKYGIYGVAYSTAGSLLIGNIIIMNYYYFVKVKLDILNFWKSIFRISIPMLVTLAFGMFLNFIITDTILHMILKILIFTLFFMIFIYFAAFNVDEKNILKSILNKKNVKIKSIKSRRSDLS
ncbi:oligosaccharide flippase family protein [Planococcus halocryophilus]|uniref:oligosaccharide flippase family protein n=1 Tax=Planococcus halocryophilus TaxID=1215089 RepID=UPI001F0F6D99|nr:oligosaccharide flippase family protein [Planococcus halocryophilus]MCH4826784.1 oligosaccharide flippase family protein [Planococcus halocryophilus]